MNKIIAPALALFLVLSFAGCKKPVEPVEPTEPVTEVEQTHWAYREVSSGTARVTEINEDLQIIFAEDSGNKIIFQAVTTDYAVDKEIKYQIFADGQIRVTETDGTYLGTFDALKDFNAGGLLDGVEGEMI